MPNQSSFNNQPIYMLNVFKYCYFNGLYYHFIKHNIENICKIIKSASKIIYLIVLQIIFPILHKFKCDSLPTTVSREVLY